MATLITIRADEAEKLGKKLKRFDKALYKNIETEFEELGRLAVIALQNETPKDEGVLSNSTRWGIYNRGTKKLNLRIEQGSPLRPKLLPVWLTFGTRRGMRPNKYIQRAWRQMASARTAAAKRIGKLTAEFLRDTR